MRGLPPPGAHGGDGPAVARAFGLDPREILDLSQSLNPVAPDPTRVVARHLDALRSYPDPGAATGALAEAIGVDTARVLLTNGGSEAISLLARVLGGRVREPDFSLYPRSPDSAAPLWRSNPHNPSGLLAVPEDSANVWDEAFYPIATASWTRADPESVVVGSLTKLLACPGLRAGYVLGDPELLARCRRHQPEWSVNGLAASALPELLQAVDLPNWALALKSARAELTAVLEAHGLSPLPSDANWVLVHAPRLRQRLAPSGVVVRDCASFDMPEFARIAVPSADGIARLDRALTLTD
ncbi:MAG: aminotransferase class I/II-fold pyridoxal phosphate-dependent enzyme [Acidimicrobiales bacterium]